MGHMVRESAVQAQHKSIILSRSLANNGESCMVEDSYSGPFVSVACICQTPLQEANGQLSIIRVTDRVQVVGITPKMQPQPLQHLFLVLIMRSGSLRESHMIKIVPVTPQQQKLQPTETSVLFEGDERGPGVITPLSILATEEGLYWFEVYLEQQFLTKIPLRVQYQRMQASPFPTPQPPQP
jgi:hypothetical protein